MTSFFKRNRLVLFFTALVGTITGLPTVLAPLVLGTAYQGIPFLPLANEYDNYLPRIHEILDGHWGVASPYLFEYKDFPVVIYPVNEWLYAIPAFLFGLTKVVVASKFILPAVLFLLTYFLLISIIRKESVAASQTAIAGGLFVVLGAEFVHYAYILRVLQGGVAIESLWTRLVNPIMGGIELMAFLLLLWMVWDKRWPHAYAAAGVLLACTVGYFFTFGLALAILSVLFIAALIRGEREMVKKLFLVGAISVILDSAWWYGMLTGLGGEEGASRAMLNGMFYTHQPILNKAVFAASLLFTFFFCYTYFYLKDRNRIREWIFAASLLIGSWLVFNQQIITGREVWYHHFVQYTVPMCVVAVLVAAYLALYRYKLLWNVMTYVLCAAMIAYGLFSVTAYTKDGGLAYYRDLQSYAPVYSWLEANAPADCVVLINPANPNSEDEANLIPAFSGCNTYTISDPARAVSASRHQHNYLLRMQMRGIRLEDAREHLLINEGYNVRAHFYTNWEQAFGKGMEPWIMQRIELLTNEYGTFIKTPLRDNIKKYRADYIMSDGPLSNEILQLLPGTSVATTTGRYFVYSFK